MADDAVVSILCVTYNHEKYISQSIEGFLSQQTDFPFEVVIADDASTDNNRKIIEEYAAKYPDIIKPILRTKNMGAAHNWIDAFRHCRGRYVAQCEGDDYWTDPHKLQMQVGFLESHRDFAICSHGTERINDRTGRDGVWFEPPEDKEYYTLEDFISYGRTFIATSSLVARNYPDVLPEWFTETPAGDMAFIMSTCLKENGKIKRFKDYMSVHRSHSGGVYSGLSTLDQEMFSIEARIFFRRKLPARYEPAFRNGLKTIISGMVSSIDSLSRSNSDLTRRNQELTATVNNLSRAADKPHASHSAASGINYKSYQDLSLTIRNNMVKIPRDVDLVVGIPRSGMFPAVMIGELLNKPVVALDSYIDGRLYEIGEYRRPANLVSDISQVKRVLIVDDSINTGKSIEKVKERVRNSGRADVDTIYCAVYFLRESVGGVDIGLEECVMPRVFQWNILNSWVMPNACVDIDGVVCVDPTEEENDDGKRYEAFLRNAEPLFLTEFRVGAFVTSRLEKYRSLTEEWLRKHHLDYGELIMLNLPSKEERLRQKAHASFKAEVFRNRKERFFIESSLSQAKQIAALTGKTVFCTENMEMIAPGPGARPAEPVLSYEELLADAESAIQSRDLDKAHFKLETILARRPNDVAALNDLAVVRILTGDSASAAQLIAKVIDIDPSNDVARQNLTILKGLLTSKLNELKESRDQTGVSQQLPQTSDPGRPASGYSAVRLSENSPIVSIIIPTRNRPEGLRRTLESIKEQTYGKIEVIVVNDAGKNVEGVVSEFSSALNVRYFQHDTNRRSGAARNTGVKAASGKYVCFIDDDDVFYPDHVETLVARLEHGDCAVAYTDAHRANEIMQNGKYVTVGVDVPYSQDFSRDKMLVANFIPILCVMLKRSILDDVGLFDESLTSHIDWDLWVRVALKFDFVHLNKVTCRFTWRHDGSTMTSRGQEDLRRTAAIVYRKYAEYSAGVPGLVELQKRQLMSWIADLRDQARTIASEGRIENAISLLVRLGDLKEEVARTASHLNFDLEEDDRLDIYLLLELATRGIAEGLITNVMEACGAVLRLDEHNHEALQIRRELTAGNAAGDPAIPDKKKTGEAAGRRDSVKLVSIIIPVFNKVEYTRKCIDALFADTDAWKFELIVVDNASSDGTREYLATLQCEIKVISNRENLGFAKACNQGSLASSGKYIVFLNNDTEPQPGWLDELLRTAETEENVGIVGSKLLYPDGTLQHAGVAINRNKIPYHIYRGLPSDLPSANRQLDYQAVTAACLMIPRDLFFEVGCFDERYVNGYEDVDLCFKVGAVRKRIVYNPASVLIHHEGKSEGRQDRMDLNEKILLRTWSDKIQQDDYLIVLRDGQELLKRGMVKKAERYFELSLALFSGRSDVKKGKEERVAELYGNAQNLIASGNLDGARESLAAALEIDPDNAACLNDMAVLASMANNSETAIRLLGRLTELEPENTIARKNLASLYMKTNRIEDALACYRTLSKALPDDVEVLLATAQACMASGKQEDAMSFYKRILNLPVASGLREKVSAVVEEIGLGLSVGFQSANEHALRSESQASGENTRIGSGPLVSIIIPVFNKMEYTKKCVEAVLRNTAYREFEVIFVDNGSTDGTSDFIQGLGKMDARFRSLHSEENLGFVKGCNWGAREAKGKYILFLNNDTEVMTGWLESLVNFAESRSDCGAVGSKLIYPDGSLQEAGGMIFSDGSGGNFGRGQDPDALPFNSVLEVDYCSGASLMVRADLFMKYGGFDELYVPAYSEDADFCFTLRANGHRVFYHPKSRVVHYESKTSGTDEISGFKKYLQINRRKFIGKWKKEILSQDEPPFGDKLLPASADRKRLTDDAGKGKFGYRTRYFFDGLSGYPEDVISFFPSLTPVEKKVSVFGKFQDPFFLSDLAGRYGFAWVFVRAYLEGRYLRLHPDERREMFDAVTDDELSHAKGFVMGVEPQLAYFLRDIAKLEATPEPTRSLFFITSAGKKLYGIQALYELYKVCTKYALMKGISDVNGNVTEETGVSAVEGVIRSEYSELEELPQFVGKIDNRVLRYVSHTETAAEGKHVKVLCFYPHNPYPPRTGADHGFIGVLDALQELGCEVDLMSSTYFTDKPWKIHEIEKFCREKKVGLYIHQADEEDHIHVRSLQLIGPSGRWDMKVPDGLRSAFAEVYAEVSPDIVLINYAWWGKLIDGPQFDGSIHVIQMHDLISLNEKMQEAAHALTGRPPYDLANVNPNALIEDVYSRLNLRGDQDEYEIYRRFNHVIGVSPGELERITEFSSGTRSILIPAPLGNRQFVTGNSYHGFPLFAIANNVFNVQAYMYFVNKVLPLIRKEVPDFQLNVIGDGCKVIQPVDGVNLLGFVDDILALYRDTSFAIAPMIGGTGQSVKILEAMANGLPVVSLKNSYQACSVRNGVDGFTAQNAEEFAEYSIRLYKDRELCRKMGENAREGISKDYSYGKIVEALKPVVDDASVPRSGKSMGRVKAAARKTGKGNGSGSARSTEAILKPYIERVEGNCVFVKGSIFDIDPGSPLASIEKFLNSLPPFYAHFGGIGDASLLLSTFYDSDPAQTIVSFGNSRETMKSFFESFAGIRKIYLMDSPSHSGVHQLIRFMIHGTRKCKGMGVAPLHEYNAEWNANIDIFGKYGIKKNPVWMDRFRSGKIQDFQVAIQPKGSLKGMVRSKQNVIDKEHWEKLISNLRKQSLMPVILGTPNERADYPALEGCIDKRDVSLGEQLKIVASSDVVIGADSWAKTFSALASIPTIVFRPVRGEDLEGWDDPADNVFIRPWESIHVVGDIDEFQSEFSNIIRDTLTRSPKKSVAEKADAGRQDDGTDRKQRLGVIWEGSQFVHHSMALINREVTLQLIGLGHDVGIIPYEKDEFNYKVDNRFTKIAGRINKKLSRPVDVHVRHQWPPNLVAPAEGHWVMIQPWEFGSLPKDWIQVMNKSVDEVWVPSTYVRDCYVKSGLKPGGVAVVPNGVNTERFSPNSKPYPLKSKKRFKFLFVGGTISRKGIDILLNAYVKSFKRSDDVCLVIKDLLGNSFYSGQTIEEDLKRISSDGSLPEIEYINEKLSEEEIAGLYTAADCLVHPYRGEGFGMPIAEALSSELPVIVTNYGAALDFCNEGNSYLIPSKVVYYEEKKIGRRETVDLPWLAEPDTSAVGDLMRHVFNSYDEAKEKARAGRKLIVEQFNWEKVGKIAERRLQALREKPVKRFVEAERKARNAPRYAQAHELIEAGNLKAAAELLEEIHRSDVDNAEAANDLAVVYSMDGKTSDAERVLAGEIERHPEDMLARKNLASIYSNQGRLDEAVALYQEILKSTPFESDALSSLGQICLKLGNISKAQEFFSLVLQRNPADQKAGKFLKAIAGVPEESAAK